MLCSCPQPMWRFLDTSPPPPFSAAWLVAAHAARRSPSVDMHTHCPTSLRSFLSTTRRDANRVVSVFVCQHPLCSSNTGQVWDIYSMFQIDTTKDAVWVWQDSDWDNTVRTPQHSLFKDVGEHCHLVSSPHSAVIYSAESQSIWSVVITWRASRSNSL